MKTAIVKLPGKKSGYACKIFLRGRHVATVANPKRKCQEGAREAAYMWNKNWRKKLGFSTKN
jgi:hypothetical protein